MFSRRSYTVHVKRNREPRDYATASVETPDGGPSRREAIQRTFLETPGLGFSTATTWAESYSPLSRAKLSMSASTTVSDRFEGARMSLTGQKHSLRNGRVRPRLCQNSRDRFLPVNSSHVDAISGDISVPIRLLVILRGGRNEFLHSLGHEPSSEHDYQLSQ